MPWQLRQPAQGSFLVSGRDESRIQVSRLESPEVMCFPPPHLKFSLCSFPCQEIGWFLQMSLCRIPVCTIERRGVAQVDWGSRAMPAFLYVFFHPMVCIHHPSLCTGKLHRRVTDGTEALWVFLPLEIGFNVFLFSVTSVGVYSGGELSSLLAL